MRTGSHYLRPRQGLHQASFREAVISAYGGRCALSGLPEPLLLDAAHIIGYGSLAAYERYRATLKTDADGMANFRFAEEKRLILSEERTFLRAVE